MRKDTTKKRHHKDVSLSGIRFSRSVISFVSYEINLFTFLLASVNCLLNANRLIIARSQQIDQFTCNLQAYVALNCIRYENGKKQKNQNRHFLSTGGFIPSETSFFANATRYDIHFGVVCRQCLPIFSFN